MIIGIPKEIKNNENRVAITPGGVKTLKNKGHQVLIEEGAGIGSGIKDEDFVQAGADIITGKGELFDRAGMIMKVKEPLPEEYKFFHEGQILFTYLHLAAERELTEALLEKRVVAIAYETIQLNDGSLPLLTPMSEIAGRLSIQVGARFLEKPQGGSGILLGGVPGVSPARVLIIGGGIAGLNAAKMAVGMGAEVTVMDIDNHKLRYIDDIYQGRIKTLISNHYNIEAEVERSDLVVGAVLIPGARTPALVTEEMIKGMREGSVVVDIDIDQGGCMETTHPTTHDDPIYVKHGVIHYSVANMPGAVARTSTYALTNATLPYAEEIASHGYRKALTNDPALSRGLNVYNGQIIYKAVAEALDMDYTSLEQLVYFRAPVNYN